MTAPIREATLLKRSTLPIPAELRQSGEDYQASGKEARSYAQGDIKAVFCGSQGEDGA